MAKCKNCGTKGIPRDTEKCPECGFSVDESKLQQFPNVLPEPEVKQVGWVGWTCPVCGRGNSPWSTVCPCKDSLGVVYSNLENGFSITNKFSD